MSKRSVAPAVRIVILSFGFFQAAASPVFASDTPAESLDSGSFKVSLDALSGFGAGDKLKIQQAADAMSEALGSEAFHQAVLGFTYAGRPQFANNSVADASGNTVETGMSNQQIYETLMASRETYLDNTDGAAHLDLTLYTAGLFKGHGVVGYGYPGKPQIFMNVSFFDSFTIAEVAGNISHEWTHKLGFDHDFKSTPQRPYSVPYGIGCLVVSLTAGTPTSDCSQGSH